MTFQKQSVNDNNLKKKYLFEEGWEFLIRPISGLLTLKRHTGHTDSCPGILNFLYIK